MAEEDNEGGVYLTKEEAEAVAAGMSSRDENYPKPEEKHGIFQFLAEVFRTKDSSKGANIDAEELFSVRTKQSGANYFGIMNANLIEQYLKDEAEIVLATSDSKDGFLIKQAITQKKDVKVGSEKKKKTGFIKKKESES